MSSTNRDSRNRSSRSIGVVSDADSPATRGAVLVSLVLDGAHARAASPG